MSENRVTESFSNLKFKRLTLSALSDLDIDCESNKLQIVKFISPYQRYKLMIPYLEELKKKEALLEKERRNNVISNAVKIGELQKESNEKELEDIYKLPLKELKKRKFEDKIEATLSTDASQPINKKPKVVETSQAVKIEPKEEIEIPSSSNKNQSQSSTDSPLKVDESEEQSSPSPNKNKKWKKKKPQKPGDFRQSSSKPIPFDFSKVDYKKFQGGSQQQQTSKGSGFSQKFKVTEIRICNFFKFHKSFSFSLQGGKGSKGNNKKMNNLFSFSSVKISNNRKK